MKLYNKANALFLSTTHRVQCTREKLRVRAAKETVPITQIYRQEVQGLVTHPGAAARMPAYLIHISINLPSIIRYVIYSKLK